MPVPKRKRSRARRDKRFANKGIKPQSVALCANCNEAVMTHQACKACGHYKGHQTRKAKSARSAAAESAESTEQQ
jgi:large subunit ribosomal protein L32